MSVSDSDSDIIQTAEPSNFQQAHDIIDDIQFRNGYVDPRDETELLKTSPEYQAKSRRKSKKERKTLARYTKTISEQLYTTKFRFIYEMIQNADDASYSNALERGHTPFLTFEICDDELVVDSNQDDFQIANVEAICSTGESSKEHDSESIGEKGLGFKSVFGVTDRVHIQSGNWSFRFEHRKNENGLGMVTPLWTDPSHLSRWTDPAPLADDIKTRFKMRYKENDRNMQNELVEEFEKMPETVIFFLHTIKEMRIVWHANDTEKRKILTKRGNLDEGEVFIRANLDGHSEDHRYKTVTQNIAGLPENDKREGRADSDVILAFPVEVETGRPVISERGQHVFAYLPLQRLPQIPFLIQADFFTSASRESIPESPWNVALRSGVAATFRYAIEMFCKEDGSLLYMWMRYLPRARIEAFWEPLYSEIKALLAACSMLRSMGGESLRLPSELRILPEEFLHNEEPLFRDLPEDDIYLSNAYTDADDVAKLTDLGLHLISWDEMIDRLAADLANPQSKMKTTDLGDEWHTAFANFVEELWVNDDEDGQLDDKLCSLNIIPLRSGAWFPPSRAQERNNIYFPQIDEGLESLFIPQGLGLLCVDPLACIVPERKTMYVNLGVVDCAAKVVTESILRQHGSTFKGTITNVLSHLEILFWYGEELDNAQRQNLHALTEDGQVRRSSTLFFRSRGEYHAEKLLQRSAIDHVPEFGFIQREFTDSKVKDQFRNQRTWEGWLENVAGVRYYPHVNDRLDASVLSPVLEAVLRDNPSQFVPTLRAHWASAYKVVCAAFPELKNSIKKRMVPCLNGEMKELQFTFLPTPESLNESRRLGVDSHMPIVKLGLEDTVSDYQDWQFLQEFGVCCDLSLRFYFEVLSAVQTQVASHQYDNTLVIDVYKSIGRISNFEHRKHLQDFFIAKKAICVPGAIRLWNAPGDCVWSGPPFLREKVPLKNHYNRYQEVSNLFLNYLDIGDATWGDILRELVSLRQRSSREEDSGIAIPSDTTLTSEIYESLYKLVDSVEVWISVHRIFEQRSLILAPNGWHKPSSCIWGCTVNISGRVAVDAFYPNLQSFFVERLQVQTANVSLLIQELIDLGSQNVKEANKLKNIMVAAGVMLGQQEDLAALEGAIQNLKRYRFLPIRSSDGGQIFEKPSANFFINDHERLSLAFADRLNFLDFSYNELTSLHPLFQCLKLEHRYLSRLVQSETIVGDSIEDQTLSSIFRQQSYALSCCAVFHQSRKFLNHNKEIHKMLMEARVFVASETWTNLLVRQGSTDVEVRSDRALLKVEESYSQLKLYLPQDPVSFQTCYRSQLPTLLMRILGVDHPRAERQIFRILTEKTTQLQNIMIEEDIPDVSWLERPHIPIDVESNVAEVEAPSDSTITEVPISEILEPSIALSGPVGLSRPMVSMREYRQLLANVVRQAKRIPNLDQEERDLEGFSMTSIQEALDELPLNADIRQILGMQGNRARSFEHNAQIGAAGELFVFERLRAWGIPNFSILNWQSTIRQHVSVLGGYEDLERWRDREIADIMYQDRSGEMEEFLRDYSHNEFPEWSAASPGDSGDDDDDDDEEVEQGEIATRHLMVELGSRVLINEQSQDKVQDQEVEPNSNDEEASAGRVENYGNEVEEEDATESERNDDFAEEEGEETYINEDLSESNGDEDSETSNEKAGADHVENHVNEVEKDDADDLERSDNSADEEGEETYIDEDHGEFVAEEPIEYQIEVKTTTGPCDTTFFVSKNQYERMKKSALEPGQRPRTVYVICRVYNLLSNDIGMRIFVDPWNLQDDMLRFVADPWQVTSQTA